MATLLQCFDVIWVDDIIATLAHGIALILAVVIGLFSRDRLGDGRTERLFGVAVIAAVVGSIGGIGQNVLCLVFGYEVKWAMIILSGAAYCVLLQCVLGVFILRLIDTFHDTTLRLSSVKQNMLAYLFVTMQLLWIADIILTSRIAFTVNRNTDRALVLPVYLWTLFLLGNALYMALCIWTVFVFCRNILHTAKHLSQFTETSTKGLDKKQLAIIDLSSKYLSLFIISLCSTVIHFALFSLFNFLALDWTTPLGVECIVNLLCILFQYDFAEGHYYRYCNRMDICCRRSLTWRMSKHDEAVKAQRAVLHLRSGSTVDERNLARELDSYMSSGTERTPRSQTSPSRDFGPTEVTITSYADSKEAVPTFSSMVEPTLTTIETESSQRPVGSTTEVKSQIAGSDLMGSSLRMNVEPSSTFSF